MTIRFIKLIFFILLGVMFSGCMLGPDYERPETAATEAESFINAPPVPSDCNEILIGGPWSQQFEDPLTNQLVVEALEHNYDLQAAAARVIQILLYLFANAQFRSGIHKSDKHNHTFED